MKNKNHINNKIKDLKSKQKLILNQLAEANLNNTIRLDLATESMITEARIEELKWILM